MSKPEHSTKRRAIITIARQAFSYGVVAAIWCIPLVLIYLALYWLSLVYLQTYDNGDLSSSQNAQISGLAMVLFLVFMYLSIRFLDRYDAGFLKRTRGLFILALPLIIINFTRININQYSKLSAAPATCNLQSTLDASVAATYPVATDIDGGQAYGSAFAVDANGTLVTAYHVIDGAKAIYANLSSGKVPISIVRTSPADDLALLKLAEPTPRFIGFSHTYKTLDDIYVVGFPAQTYGAGGASISKGIISRIINGNDLHAADNTIPEDDKFVQVDAAINHGNSGGPTVDNCGIVGVADQISITAAGVEYQRYGQYLEREEGINYAISADTIKSKLGL